MVYELYKTGMAETSFEKVKTQSPTLISLIVFNCPLLIPCIFGIKSYTDHPMNVSWPR